MDPGGHRARESDGNRATMLRLVCAACPHVLDGYAIEEIGSAHGGLAGACALSGAIGGPAVGLHELTLEVPRGFVREMPDQDFLT